MKINAKIAGGLFAATLLGFAVTARAEAWIDVVPSTSQYFSQLDQDSVVPTTAGRFSATWRAGAALDRTYDVKHGVVDCAGEFIQLETTTHVIARPGRFEIGETMTDYVAGTTTAGNRTSPLPSMMRKGAFEFPYGYSPLLQQVCQGHYASLEKRAADVAAIQKAMGCATGTAATPALCAEDEATTRVLGALFFRLDQVERGCSLTRGQVERLLGGLLSSVNECTRTSKDCVLPLLKLEVSGLQDDIARFVNKEGCGYVQARFELIAESEGRQAGLARFKACVKRSIPALDDRISSADVIASGVLGACQGELGATPAQLAIFSAGGVMSGLTAAVLEFRRLARQPVAKPRPKPPQT